MKNFLYGLTVLFLAFTTSCSKDDSLTDDLSTNLVSNRNIENSGIWFVTLFSEDDRNQTNQFVGYSFEFKSNGLITASKAGVLIHGNWRYVTDSGKSKVIIGFSSGGIFDEISEDWEILQESDTSIKLKHVSGGNGGLDLLEFGRSPGAGSTGVGTTTTTTVPSGLWKVTRYLDKDKNRTSHYTGYSFDFKSGGVITATQGSTIIQGSWKNIVDSGKSKMVFTFPEQNKFDELNDDWEVILQNATSIQLKNVSGGNGGTSYLDFGK